MLVNGLHRHHPFAGWNNLIGNVSHHPLSWTITHGMQTSCVEIAGQHRQDQLSRCSTMCMLKITDQHALRHEGPQQDGRRVCG